MSVHVIFLKVQQTNKHTEKQNNWIKYNLEFKCMNYECIYDLTLLESADHVISDRGAWGEGGGVHVPPNVSEIIQN